MCNASKENIELGDTALGRVKRRKMSECKQALRDMSEEEFQDLIAARANRATERWRSGCSVIYFMFNVHHSSLL